MKFVVNPAGFNALRTSSIADAALQPYAEKIAANANAIASTTNPAADEPYYEVHEAGDEKRARYRVTTTSIRASRHEQKTFALERARAGG